MALTADWTMRTEHVPLFEAAKMCGENQHTIKQKYRAGTLGPAPDVRVDVSGIPLYHLASLLIIHEAEKRGVGLERIVANLPTLAGAAYIRFQLSEIRAGRCDQRGGTSTLNNKLWALLHSDKATSELENLIPGGPISTKRFGGFTATDTIVYDTPEELQDYAPDMQVIDAWSVASRMQRGLRGIFLATFIP